MIFDRISANGDNDLENMTLVRKGGIVMGSTIFDMTEWDEYAQDTFTYIGAHTAE